MLGGVMKFWIAAVAAALCSSPALAQRPTLPPLPDPLPSFNFDTPYRPGVPAVLPPLPAPFLFAGVLEYPLASLRARESGTVRLDLCVDKEGRLRSAAIKESSGHARLDRDTLSQFIGLQGHALFMPAEHDGGQVDFCGYILNYEWRISGGAPKLPDKVALPGSSEPLLPFAFDAAHGPDTPDIKAPSATKRLSYAFSYPVESWRAAEAGNSWVMVCVDSFGRVRRSELAESSGHARLDEAAVSAFTRAERTPLLNPAMLDGMPVDYCGYKLSVRWSVPPGSPPTQ